MHLCTITCTILATVLSPPLLAANTIVRIETNVGGFNVELYDTETPLTVTNFLNYVNRGDYNNTVIHRSAVTGFPPVPFIIQGGGYGYANAFGVEFFYDFPNDPPVQNEFSPSRSNVRGTMAMAKLGGDPNSATSEWFVNLGDNSTNLDNQNGGFTVFGRVIDPGMKVVDAIANLGRQGRYISLTDGTVRFFGELPITSNNGYVIVDRVCINNDADGACPQTEDMAPNNDGNGDGIPDRDQANVTTIQAVSGGGTATISAGAGMTFNDIRAVNLSSTYFNNGMFAWQMSGTMGSAGQVVTLRDGAATRPDSYYAYGPTPDNLTPHWYDFTFDGETGAEIGSDRITLHFVDGKRGDDDLVANNSITHTGAQAVLATFTSAQDQPQSGGCSITAKPSPTSQSGDWILVSLFLTMLALVRRRARGDRDRDATSD